MTKKENRRIGGDPTSTSPVVRGRCAKPAIRREFLARQVKADAMDLAEVQRGIAQDWTQYLDAAKKAQLRKKSRLRRN